MATTRRKRFLIRLAIIVLISIICWKYAWDLHEDSLMHLNLRQAKPGPLPSASHPSSNIQLGDKADNMLHFMHITDIHISKFNKVGGLTHLQSFLKNELPLVAPDLVLCTGDLTDAKFKHKLTSQQHRVEWVSYHDALSQSKVLERQNSKFWWDMRGNHDCYSVPSFNHSLNLYTSLSAVKTQGYSFTVTKPFGEYSFVALDACPNTGLSKPLSFFGYLDSEDMDFLAESLERAQTHNHVFVLTHYPLSCMHLGKTRQGRNLKEFAGRVSLWLSGHLHTFFGDELYAHRSPGVLELELGDMKSNGLFRTIVVDHDLVSFRDFTISGAALPMSPDDHTPFTGYPLVHITNPKDARYVLPDKEPLGLTATSTHIRVLVWSSLPISSVCAEIDGIELNNATYNGVGSSWSSIQATGEQQPYLPLWTITWNPKAYQDGKTHTLTVFAIDNANTAGKHTVHFRLDGKKDPIKLSLGKIMMTVQLGLFVNYLLN